MAERISFSSQVATTVWIANDRGRRFNHAHVAQSNMDIQRARIGVAEHRQHIDFLAVTVSAAPCGERQALLFVDNYQAKIGELDVLESTRCVPTRSPPCRFRPFPRSPSLLRGAEARDHFDIYGNLRSAFRVS